MAYKNKFNAFQGGSQNPDPAFKTRMNLFGTPATSTASSFSFGAAPATSTAAPLFGSQAASKPLFGSTTQPSSTPSLFGAVTSTATTGTSLFGNTATTSTATSGGLFGGGTSGGLFSKPATTAAPFGSSTTGGLFGAKPATGGLFGSVATAAQPAATVTKSTLTGLVQDADALVRSLTAPEIFGDERDQIVAKLNQCAAALGVGAGVYKSDQQPIAYTAEGPFYRMKTIGFNRVAEYSDCDGIVSLTMNVPHTELQSSAQKQKLLDSLFAIMGSKPTVHAKIESIKQLPDNLTEVCIYVEEKGSGRVKSSLLAQFFNEPNHKAQLEQQLRVDKDKIVCKMAMSKQQRLAYLKQPPIGYDSSVWAQAMNDNPDVETLIPFPIRGFEQLKQRQKAQVSEIAIENQVVDAMQKRLGRLDMQFAESKARVASQRAQHKILSHRLLRILAMQLMNQRFAQGVDATEDHLQGMLETLNARLNGPSQIKECVTKINHALADDDLKNCTMKPHSLSETNIKQVQEYLLRCQDGIESLAAAVRSNLRDIEIIAREADR